MLVVLFILSFIFLFFSTNLLLNLIVLELLRFFVMYYVTVSLSLSLISDFILIIFFSVFVMEGVVALSGLIFLVRFSGSDYVRSFRFMKL